MHGERLTFETRISVAERALHALAVGLRSCEAELVLLVANHAREEVLASYRAWEQLGEPGYGRLALAELRDRGHRVLAPCLAYAPEHATAFTLSLTSSDRASEVALVAMLWKVSDALDRADESAPV